MRKGTCVYCGKNAHYSETFVCDHSAGQVLPFSLSKGWEPPESKNEQIKALKKDLWHQEQRKLELLKKIASLEMDVRRLSGEFYSPRRKIK